MLSFTPFSQKNIHPVLGSPSGPITALTIAIGERKPLPRANKSFEINPRSEIDRLFSELNQFYVRLRHAYWENFDVNLFSSFM